MRLDLDGGFWFLLPVFDDGPALFAATCEQGLEGVVAKRRDSFYRPGERGWVKVKNRSYWRFGEERELRIKIASPPVDDLRPQRGTQRVRTRRAIKARPAHVTRLVEPTWLS